MSNLSRYRKFDYRVQLMRIFACLIVIGCHVRLDPVFNDSYNSFSLFLHGFFDDGVGIFFAIMGFFIGVKERDDEPIFKSVGKAFVRVLVPVLFFMLLISFLSRWINGEVGFLYCFTNPFVDYKMIAKSFINLNWGMDTTFGHLWYITSYLQLIVAMPLINLLTLDHPYAKKARRWILFINILAIFVLDARALLGGKLRYISAYEILSRAFTFLLVGYCIYKNRDFILKHKLAFRFASLIMMVGINGLKYFFQTILFKEDFSNIHFYLWSAGTGFIFTVCFICFFLSFEPGKRNTKGEGIVGLIGSATFFVYIIHMAVLTFLNARGLKCTLYSSTIDVSNNTLSILGYDLTYPLIVFAISLAICILPAWGYDAIMSKLFKKGAK